VPEIAADASGNIMQNGVYEFIKAHMDANLMDRLATAGFFGSHAYVNGAYYLAGHSPESMGTVTSSGDRKLVSGLHNPSYKGNISSDFVNYAKTNMMEYKNVNIIIDQNDPLSQDSRESMKFANVSIVGDNPSNQVYFGTFYGVIDIEGSAPGNIMNVDNDGYLILHKIPDSSIGFSNFKVLDITKVSDDKIEYVGSFSNYGNNLAPTVIKFAKKAHVTGFGAYTGGKDYYYNDATKGTSFKAVGGKYTGNGGDWNTQANGDFKSKLAGNLAPSLDPADFAATVTDTSTISSHDTAPHALTWNTPGKTGAWPSYNDMDAALPE
jgi:hypothetical protein